MIHQMRDHCVAETMLCGQRDTELIKGGRSEDISHTNNCALRGGLMIGIGYEMGSAKDTYGVA